MMNADNDTEKLLDNSDDGETFGSYHGRRRSVSSREKMKVLLSCLVIGSLISFLFGLSAGALYGYGNSSGIFNNFKPAKISKSDPRWTYDCKTSKCVRRRRTFLNEPQISLETCNMLCSIPSLWPKPKSLRTKNGISTSFNKNHISLRKNVPIAIEKYLREAINIFMNNLPTLRGTTKAKNINDSEVIVDITVASHETKLSPSTNESYSLSVTQTRTNVLANITAPTYFGARHALETLSQLIWSDSSLNSLRIYHDIFIEDAPAFPHRGVMVDTARNFFPVERLLRVIEGMAASKLNVFHLHLTDAVSFPVVLPNNPQFAQYGAYQPDMVYTVDDIKGLIEFARIRGIRTILEIDAPSHLNEGWNYPTENKEKLVICGEEDVFNGHLNPDNKQALDVLQSIYQDLLALGTDNETFHVGGDEVNMTCYGQTKSAVGFNSTNDFWVDFANNIFKTVITANHNRPPNNLVIWSSPLTDYYIQSLKYPKDIVVQYWFGSLEPILRNGNKVIFSTVGKWYLDCGFGPWKPSDISGVCDPYTSWQTFYKYRPWSEYADHVTQVLGGEACLWSEQVDVSALETRIWPRAAAMAERLWTDEESFDSYDVFSRMSSHRERLIERGFQVSAIWPLWCTLNPGKC
ncbi:unnamed protein product [Phaedon cochleariae]|uniref:Beta-hexosaminidase n=1 Tax=Phaedon cochleariae TaxID=80249 RepID=A0A9N9X2F4_PHACE|nr:unnamed protein product [Phaedon cochleariae]